MRYFQTVTLIERQYRYIHLLEERISSAFDNIAFTREGKSYLDNYPRISDWAHILYSTVFPVLLLFVITVKIVAEWLPPVDITAVLIFNSVIFVMIVISTALHLLRIHFNK